MLYRAAVDANSVVIGIGADQLQAGNYAGIGTWCTFTFSAIPSPTADVLLYLSQCQWPRPSLKVSAGAIVSRTLLEMQTAYGRNITGASNASPIAITSTAHGLTTGTKVTITGVLGNTAANVVSATITVIDANTFSLNATTGNGVYASSYGIATIG